MRYFLCLVVLLFITAPAPCPAVTAEKSPPNGDPGKSGDFSERVQEFVKFLEETSEDFTYQRQNRPDPFMPFIPRKPVAVEKKKIDKDELKGLRKYEPGQLSVVAIMTPSNAEARAMVQNASGEGFVIKPGTKIGRYGVVESISDNVVKIEEKYEMTTGEFQTQTVKMLLKKEGEE